MTMKIRFNFILILSFLIQIQASKEVRHERLKIENPRYMLNKKPYNISLKMGMNDIYDCVDIYKQPAFYHPLLRNHTIQLKPSIKINDFKDKSAEGVENFNLDLRKSCPEGTVPIRQTRKDGLFRAKRDANIQNKANSILSLQDQFGNSKVMLILSSGKNFKYYGLEASMDVYNISSRVKDDQGSSGQILLLKGEDGPADYLNTIQFGWAIDHRRNADLNPLFFMYWTSDGYNRTGCTNFECPGYVQISKTFSPGMILPPGKGVVKLALQRDPSTLNWLLFKRNGADSELIGYFPKEIFNNMADVSQVQIGGITYSPDKEETVPPMGSGVRPGDQGDACEFKQVAVMGGDGKYSSPDLSYVYLYEPYPEFYEVAVPSDRPSEDGFVIQYGGPGGQKI